ncbi:MAG: hypothetical protein AAGM22_09145 [Acidobacteriota bacterium]
MADSTFDQRLGQALADYDASSRRLAGRAADPPAPGDLFLLGVTADWAFEWLVVAAAEGGRWRLVATDSGVMVGRSDLAVDLPPAGPVTIRCARSVTVPPTALQPDLRVGAVAPEVLPDISRRLAPGDTADGSASAPASAEAGDGADDELEYLDWCREHLVPALDAVDRAWGEVEARAPVAAVRAEELQPEVPAPRPTSSATIPAAPIPSTRTSAPPGDPERFSGWQLAAAVVLSAGLAYTLGTLGSFPSSVTPGSLGPQLNPRLEWFQPATEVKRGEPSRVVKPEGEWLTVVLETWDPRKFEAYGVDLERRSDSEILWSTRQLERQGASEVLFLLPTSMLPTGDYVFRLNGYLGGEETRLEDFSFQVEAAAAAP